MGRLSHESSRSSIDTTSNGEGLPLYSDVTVTSPGELTVPSEKATADEVREFLMQLLVKNRGLHPDHARRIASKWTLGTGRELMSYPPRLYAEMFGLEDAWMVYKEAKLFIRTQKQKGKPKGLCKSQSTVCFLGRRSKRTDVPFINDRDRKWYYVLDLRHFVPDILVDGSGRSYGNQNHYCLFEFGVGVSHNPSLLVCHR